MTIQSEMSERALELLALPEDSPAYILDIGCGSGEIIFIIKIIRGLFWLTFEGIYPKINF